MTKEYDYKQRPSRLYQKNFERIFGEKENKYSIKDKEYNEKQYMALLKSGMFWEFHPELTGVWDKDKDEWMNKHARMNSVIENMEE